MNYLKFKNSNIVCFQKNELQRIYERAIDSEIERKITFDKMLDIPNVIANKISKSKDHEIFAALYTFLKFYEKNSQLCFELKNNFNVNKEIKSLTDLKDVKEEDTLNDFIIKSKNGFRLFQLKRYRNKLDTDEILKFIKSKLSHYGNNLGNTNLLIILQSKERNLSKIDFKKINKEINNFNLKSKSQILVTYNENNKFQIINQIYPKLTITKIPFKLPSAETNL